MGCTLPLSENKRQASTVVELAVLLCPNGMNLHNWSEFPSPSFLSSLLPPEFVGMNTYTICLWICKITKGLDKGKVPRKRCRRIKSDLFLGCAHVVSPPL